MPPRNSSIQSKAEFLQVKAQLRQRAQQTENQFLQRHQLIQELLTRSGLYANSDARQSKEHLHAWVVQAVAQYLEDEDVFGASKAPNEFVVPVLTLGASILLTRFFT